jgi:SAM-dependent methyltransferase
MNTESIRGQYAAHGVQGYYEHYGADYRNPHESIIRATLDFAVDRWSLRLERVLDLACGSGEVTLFLREKGAAHIDGIDPYTDAAYFARTGSHAEPFTFADIAAGAIADRSYSLIICSFALHLAEESRLPLLCFQLAAIAPALLILTPHKRPTIKLEWGWHLQHETLNDRVRARLYSAVGR